jgi:glutathione peroxidase
MINLNYIILGIFGWIINIYSFSIKTLQGEDFTLEKYKGKKILLVNIATNSPYANTQLHELEKFYQVHKDSIVVIGFPSNSFGNEPHNNSELKEIIQNDYHLSFPVVERTEIVGTEAHTIYKWLQSSSDNGVKSAKVKDDFQKFLISKDGNLIGLFASKTSVTDTIIKTAIQ